MESFLSAELPMLHSLSIARWVRRGSDTLQCEIHGFADASTSAYGAAVYLRISTFDGTVKSFLIKTKSKVAPLKPMSIPLGVDRGIAACQMQHIRSRISRADKYAVLLLDGFYRYVSVDSAPSVKMETVFSQSCLRHTI